MQHRLTATPTSIRGSGHALAPAVRSTLRGAIIALTVALIAGGATLFWLNGEIGRLAERRDRLQAQQLQLERERAALLAAVASARDELTQDGLQPAGLNEHHGGLGAITGVGKAPAADGARARLYAASQARREKLAMLQQIPSGSPVPEHGITSPFGWRIHPVTGKRAFHDGIDLRAAAGTPVHATADGVVEWAARHQTSGLGKLIILRHNFGFRTFFAHLDSVAVQPGDYVRRGEVIGRVGSTGLSNGPHLHYEVRYIHRKFDPVPFLNWNLNNYDALFMAEDGVRWGSLARAVTRQLNGGRGLEPVIAAQASTP